MINFMVTTDDGADRRMRKIGKRRGNDSRFTKGVCIYVCVCIWRTSLDRCYGYIRGIFKRAGEYRFIFVGIYILFARYRYHAARDSILIERCFLIRLTLLIVFSRPY